jgi:hypothetical protein
MSTQNIMVLLQLVKVLHPPQKFDRLPFSKSWTYGIEKYGVEVIFICMTSLPNFIKNLLITSEVK